MIKTIKNKSRNNNNNNNNNLEKPHSWALAI